MAGTNRHRASKEGGPAVILVRPQLGENIGTTARAMLNCGLTDLRLVSPREGWPNEKAISAASGALKVIEHVQVYDSLEEALHDQKYVYVTTARPRDMNKPVVSPEQAVDEMVAYSKQRNANIAVVFGPERTGLRNNEVCLGQKIIEIPLNPEFCSLNLAQAVLIVAYNWFSKYWDSNQGEDRLADDNQRASFEDYHNFFLRLEDKLEKGGFFKTKEIKPHMVTNIRNMFTRADFSENELNTLHGMIVALVRSEKN